tara:strand:- start:2822 stop:3265 length:444 start_codon:yes stop_codon:yes gene_type:complete
MKPDQFEDTLDLYGPDLSVWPDEDRRAAEQLLETSTDARAMLDDAWAVDDALNDFTVEDPSPELDARLLDLAPAPPAPAASTRKSLLGWLDMKLFVSAGAALACAAFGLVIGLNSVTTPEWSEEADEFLTAAVMSYDTALWEDGEEG